MKIKQLNLILLPKLSNKYKLECGDKDEIIGIFINNNDKNYLRQIFDDELIKNFNENILIISNLKQIINIINSMESLNIIDTQTLKLVLLRDLFFCLKNSDIKDLTSYAFIEICKYLLENEKNVFLKNEILSKYIYTIINYNEFYQQTKVEDFDIYKIDKTKSDLLKQAYNILILLFHENSQLKKNIINYYIDLLFYYNNDPHRDLKKFLNFFKDKNSSIENFEDFNSQKLYEKMYFLDIVNIFFKFRIQKIVY